MPFKSSVLTEQTNITSSASIDTIPGGANHQTNVAIAAAAKRWPQLLVADWNAFSTGKPWFGDDGLHLTTTGATALATFLRSYVWKAAAAPGAH